MNVPSYGRPRAFTVVLSVLVLSVVVGGVAVAAGPAIQTFTPRSERQITNIDVLRQQIRNYYGDPLGTGVFADDSYYAKEAGHVAAAGTRWLDARAHSRWPGYGWSNGHKQRAIVLDVDDTTLTTWNYEIYSNWAYNAQFPLSNPPKTMSNADFVLAELFPATPGMVDMVKKAAKEGYAIFFITGRPATQEAATLGNLGNVGYPSPTTLGNGEDGLFTKPATTDYPQYLVDECGQTNGVNNSCSTIQYKSATRAHIESLGYDIEANFGDQFSDLKGGYADKTFKMPNPNYYLP